MDEHMERPRCVLLPGASYSMANPECNTRRATTRLVDVGGPAVHTHADCVCNEERALRGRHLVDTGARVGNLSGVASVLLRLAASLRQAGVERQSAQDYIDNYEGKKRELLIQARASLKERAIEPLDARVSMFLKDDKYVDELKEPRCIQYRSKRFHLYVGRFLHPIESAVMEHLERGVRFCAKSRNSLGRAEDLYEMWSSYSDPVAVLLDHSKFDAHITVDHLRLEHWFYTSVVPDPRLKKVLRWQLMNKGRTKHGTKYEVQGTRMSGDVNTGLGNTVLNYAMLASWLECCGVDGRVYVDGDDSVVVLSSAELTKLDYGYWKTMGMETKVEYAYEFEHVEFCQCRPVLIAQPDTYRMVRSPVRVLTRAPWTVKKYDEVGYMRLIRTIGWCELASNGSVPVLQEFASWFMDQGAGRLLRHEIRSLLRDRIEHVEVQQPTYLSRLSFEQAWGVPVDLQLYVERTHDWAALL